MPHAFYEPTYIRKNYELWIQKSKIKNAHWMWATTPHFCFLAKRKKTRIHVKYAPTNVKYASTMIKAASTMVKAASTMVKATSTMVKYAITTMGYTLMCMGVALTTLKYVINAKQVANIRHRVTLNQ